jgi:tetraacyldisaccharide 4'-kinase
MKERLAAWLERRWYGGETPGPLLDALSTVYGAIGAARRRRFLAGAGTRLPLPLLVVGNVAIGGAGKTPLTIALCAALRARGWRPGVISRGYGGRSRVAERVLPGSDPARVGDEPVLIARDGVPVAVARRRVEAARLLIDSREVDLLLADDGLQHYALRRDVEICVIDGRRRHGNGRLLPAGPLREPPARADTCDFVVVNGGAAEEGEVPMRLELDRAVALDDGASRPLAEFAGARVHAVAGIGDPSRFFAALAAHGIDVVPHPFPDHHAFRATDLAVGDAAPLLMTAKDAVKCRGFAAPGRWYVPARAVLPESFFDAVDLRLRSARDTVA